MTGPIPMSELIADDLLLDSLGSRRATGGDPVVGLLAALATHADQPLRAAGASRRSRRGRFLSALAVITVGASGAGVAAAVTLPDAPVQAGRAVQDRPGDAFGSDRQGGAPGTVAGGVLVRRADGTFAVVRPDGAPSITFGAATLPGVLLGASAAGATSDGVRDGSVTVSGEVREVDRDKASRPRASDDDGSNGDGSGDGSGDDSGDDDAKGGAKPGTKDPGTGPTKDRAPNGGDDALVPEPVETPAPEGPDPSADPGPAPSQAGASGHHRPADPTPTQPGHGSQPSPNAGANPGANPGAKPGAGGQEDGPAADDAGVGHDDASHDHGEDAGVDEGAEPAVGTVPEAL